MPRARVLRERGRRDVDQGRCRPHRAGHARAVPPRARSTTRRAVEAGYVVRMPKAYPVYDEHYQAQRRRRCASGSSANTPNVFPCGRNGMHKYNNQDHSMFTAMLSVENILGARPRRVGGQRRGRVPRAGRRRRHEAARPAATRRCSRGARSTPRPRRGPQSRRRMPPAGEPARRDRRHRADVPDARALRPHYPCLGGTAHHRCDGPVLPAHRLHDGPPVPPGFLVDGAPRARARDVLRALGVPALPAVRRRRTSPTGSRRALAAVPEEPVRSV